MSKTNEQTTEDQSLDTTCEVNPEQKEASETASVANEDLSFMDDDVEVIEVGDTEVVFKEPTDEQLPKDTVAPASTGNVGTNFWDNDGDWKATVIGETTEGKQLQVMKREEGAGYKISWADGGVVPPDCDGWFTSYDKAEIVARTYLSKNWENKNA